MSEDLVKRTENAAKGITLQTNPDERRRYLGSLRERVFIRMDNEEVLDTHLQKIFLNHIKDYEGYTVLINGKCTTMPFIDQVEAACAQNNIKFTLVSNETARTGAHDSAILVVNNKAINKPRIEINQVYPPEFPKEELPVPEKHSFWKKLFHGDNQ